MLNPAFFGIYNGYRGIAAAQAGLNTIGHNIANINTPGYSRQQIELSAFTPYTTPNLSNLASQGQVGQGVVVQSTQRIRQTFLDDQFRNVNTQLGQDSEVNDTLKSLEAILKETGNTGVGSSLQKFFDSAQDLSLHPESAASRTSFIQNAKDLVNAFKQRATQLTALQTSLISTNSTSQLSSAVSDVNTHLQAIADLNKQILAVTSVNGQPNDLLDKRDTLVDELSKYGNITTTTSPGNQIDVTFGGVKMVARGQLVDTLQLIANPGGGTLPSTAQVPTLVRTVNGLNILNDGTSAAQLTNGKMKGILDAAGNTTNQSSVYQSLSDLNSIIVAVVNEVNNLQATGRDINGSNPATNVPIFTPTAPVTPPLEIMQYQVNTAVVNNPNLIAAASDSPAFPSFSGQGDGSNALAIAQLRNKTITAYPATPLNATFQDFLNNSISKLGVDSKSFGDRTDTGTALSKDIDLQRQSVSGVNLDEELTDMLRYQRAFEASSKMITTFDDVVKGILSLVN